MPDVWATFNELDARMQERLAGVLETRGADSRQQEMRRAFLEDIPFPADAHVLEAGCGTGVLTRVLARTPNVATVVGIDVAPALLSKARDLAADLTNVTFQEADARSLPFQDETFDVVVFDSTLTHVPGPERALTETFRVLRPQGYLAAFDGDYATTTVALGDHDPLQTCADSMMANSVNNRWLGRRLPALVRSCGFDIQGFGSHGFVETTESAYMLTIVERGADILLASGQIGEETAAALKAEARRRVAAGAFFGHIAYVSVIARKPS
ncbi:MAG TPA: methyltransferase domain-containing protein [Rubrobacteraceae bacterium]|nr:methyltransferase domain-containing protein [Rubrobacteraceae bacterium]